MKKWQQKALIRQLRATKVAGTDEFFAASFTMRFRFRLSDLKDPLFLITMMRHQAETIFTREARAAMDIVSAPSFDHLKQQKTEEIHDTSC